MSRSPGKQAEINDQKGENNSRYHIQQWQG